MPPLSKEKSKRKERKNDIKLKGSQVMLYIDQQGYVKHKSDDLKFKLTRVL